MITIKKVKTQTIRAASDVVIVRQLVRTTAVEAGFGIVDQTKIVTAASELARNTLDYGKGGELLVEELTDGIRTGVRLTFTDQGPGIADIKLALTDGYTTGSGLGMGLSGSKRLMSEFEITSAPGQGTKVVVTKWK